jgi:tetratricopeptide (TPR) repeat protein
MKKFLLILFLLASTSSFAQNKKSFLRNGNTLYADSSYKEAEMQYLKSLEKDQDYFNASFNLADAVYKQENYSDTDTSIGSSTRFKTLINKTRNDEELAEVYHNLGNSLVKEQKLEEAINAYKNALRINPNDNETRHNLALSKQQKQKQEQEKENKEEKKENKEEKKENKEEEEEDKEEQKDDKEEENKKQENDNEEDQKQNQSEEKKEEMSKEDAEKMLEAIQQQEKKLQEELQKKKFKGKKINLLKDW